MFSFRRKPRKDSGDAPQIRTSPSLPELSASGIPWPESLVDRSALPQGDQELSSPQKGAERTKFSSDLGGVPPFHRPWSKGTESSAGSISSIYMSHPPSAFDNRKGSLSMFKRSRPSQRKARNPTTFNIMVSSVPVRSAVIPVHAGCAPLVDFQMAHCHISSKLLTV